jgi:hypothetical protein
MAEATCFSQSFGFGSLGDSQRKFKGLDNDWSIRYTSIMQITKEQLEEIIKETVRVAYSWEGVASWIAMPEVIKEITDKYYYDENEDENET